MNTVCEIVSFALVKIPVKEGVRGDWWPEKVVGSFAPLKPHYQKRWMPGLWSFYTSNFSFQPNDRTIEKSYMQMNSWSDPPLIFFCHK